MTEPSHPRKRIPQPQAQFLSRAPLSRQWWVPDPPDRDPSDPSYLCRVCRHIDFEYLIFKCRFIQITEEIALDKLNALLQRTQCAFCRLVRQTLEHYHGINAVSTISRDNSLAVSMIATCRYPQTANRDPWQLKIWIKPTPQGLNANPPLFIHYVEEDRNWANAVAANRNALLPEVTDLLVMDLWLFKCREGIDSCEAKPQSVERRDFPAGFRLINVRDKCVVAADKSYDYFALSYVWGKSPYLRLTKENQDLLSSKDGLARASAPIPRTIQDAMKLTANLGFRYLWVDSLCILQDDPVVFQAQIDAMRSIYSQATLTIAAAYGEDANAGLPGIEPGSRNTRVKIEKIQDVTLAPKAGDFGDLVDRSYWNTRGWTYQERLLSSRVIYFTARQVFFKCEHHDEPQSEETFMGEKRVQSSNPTSDGGRDLIPKRHSVNTITYKQTVEEYSKRNLSKIDDILDAFAGASEHLGELFRSRMLYGLPETELVYALLWIPTSSISRRVSETTSIPTYPSWSWAGWVGAVRWSTGLTLPRIQFVLASGEMMTPDELRRPSSKAPLRPDRSWWKSSWTEVVHNGDRVYYHESPTDSGSWFAHPTAPLESRSISSTLTLHGNQPSSVLRFWAETIDLDFKSFVPPAEVQGAEYWFYLFDKETLQRRGGVVYVPTQYLKDIPQKKLDLVRMARFRAAAEKEDNDWQRVLERDTLRASTESSSTMPLESIHDEETSLSPAYFPNRPRLDRGKPGIDQQYFDMQKPFCCYHLLLIEWVKPDLAERIGYALMHIDLWAQQQPVFKQISLA